jgi:invasion protein IalB
MRASARAAVALVALCAALFAAASAAAQTRELGSFQDWRAFQVKAGKTSECFAHAAPVKSEIKAGKRGKVSLSISHRPADKVRDEVSFTAGYPIKPDSSVELRIDKQKWNLFVSEDRAYAPDAATDAAIAKAMRAGTQLAVKATSAKGTPSVDTFSLRGFTAAHNAIATGCPAPGAAKPAAKPATKAPAKPAPATKPPAQQKTR